MLRKRTSRDKSAPTFSEGFLQFSSLGLIIGGYAIAFGLLAVRSGMSILETCVMSLTVYAGASQFMALSLFKENASLWTLALATFAINSRHFLYGINIGNKYSGASTKVLMALSFGLTDEAYAFNTMGPGKRHRSIAFFVGTATCAYLCWNMGTALGAVLGCFFSTFSTEGLDFAVLAVFVAMMGSTVKSRVDMLIIACSLALASLVYSAVGGHWHLFVVGILIPLASAGVIKTSRRRRT